jgi:8-oxo-dGTP diphosphatase
MPRAQCIVYRENKLLMAKHRDQGVEWWCLPGGGVENGETPAEAALRELYEECSVEGAIVRQTSYLDFGSDPEFQEDNQALVDVQWLALHEIPERDRAFLWAAGLLGVGSFLKEVEGWGDAISFPGNGPDRS